MTASDINAAVEEAPEYKYPSDELLDELASIDPVKYDPRRQSVLDEYPGLRATTLDKEIAKRRREGVPTGSGSEVIFNTPELLDRDVGSDELMNTLIGYITRYLILPERADIAISLWILHTYTHQTARISPILAITSPDMRCGKSTVISVLSRLCCKPLLASNISPSAVFRTTEKYQPSLLIDEADTFLKDNEELRGIINCGHTRDTAFVIRNVPSGDDFEPRQYSTWAPKAIAKIGGLPATIADRSINVSMRRKMDHEQVEKLSLVGSDDSELVAQLCATWANQNMVALHGSSPELPTELNDRAQDNWTPLLSISEQLGGVWTKRASDVALALSLDKGDDESVGTMLLSDLMDTFGSENRMPTHQILEELVKLEDRPWAEWNRGKQMSPRGLARQLEKYEIKPTTIRFTGGPAKGYMREDLQDAFNRYVLPLRTPNNPLQPVTPLQTSPDAGFSESVSVTKTRLNGDVTDDSRNTLQDVTDRNPLKRSAGADCYGVTDRSEDFKGRGKPEGGKHDFMAGLEEQVL